MELVKCPKCGWVHAVIDGPGRHECFHCQHPACEMVKAEPGAAPDGSTIQCINRAALKKKRKKT